MSEVLWQQPSPPPAPAIAPPSTLVYPDCTGASPERPVRVWPAPSQSVESSAVAVGAADGHDLSLKDGALRILHGDVRERLRGMDAESVHCVCTSPPYYAVRSYPGEGQVWGGDSTCK
jgi:hypothetical protein